MNADEIRNLKQMISVMSMYYGRKLEDAVIGMYAGDLGDLDFAEVTEALTRYRRDPKNRTMFLPAHIRQMVEPEKHISIEAQAREIAARICAAVPRFGYCNAPEAREFIGATGWGVVQRQGGWTYICENLGHNINPSTFQAQLRDQLKGDIEFGSALEAKVLELPTREKSQLTSTADILKTLNPGAGQQGGL